MTASASPIVRLERAIRAESLELVRLTATELPRIELDTALRILLLIGSHEPETYERAAVRWAGQAMAKRPLLGFEGAGGLLDELDALGPRAARGG